jgi:hypothetical protein
MVTSSLDFSTLMTRDPLVPSIVLPVIVVFLQYSAMKSAPMREPVIWLFAKTLSWQYCR